MLLVHQVGSVKLGEVVRYTVTYVPSRDRILPPPEKLYLRIRNTSTLVLRGAFVHGPYTLSVAAYPSTFNPNEKFPNPRRDGVPEFEPMLKAASSWECELLVPENIRREAGVGSREPFGNEPEHDGESVSWIVEVASQVIFSGSAVVGFEVTLARDKKSLDLSSGTSAPGRAQPGKVSDHQPPAAAKPDRRHHEHPPHPNSREKPPSLQVRTANLHRPQPKGVYSKAIRLKVEDTGVLWNKPSLPRWEDGGRPQTIMSATELGEQCARRSEAASEPDAQQQKQKRVHLVILSHGLHSNLGSDMLFMKESIDAAVEKAKVDKKARRKRERAERKGKAGSDNSPGESRDPECEKRDQPSHNTGAGGEVKDAEEDPERREHDTPDNKGGVDAEVSDDDDEEDDDDEQVIVRGFSGNSMRTERGIKYLGKRLARYILSMTYPDQPYLPPSSKAAYASLWTDGTAPQSKHSGDVDASGQDILGSIVRPFKITSISFVGHSLGGLIQTYAIAYCQKHSPDIFNLIEPINFIALATPFLGLGNENPLYVKFALDSGLVGRTGKDLGLSWSAPTLARSGFDALMSNLGDMAQKKLGGDSHPESKPLLRILPTGPAHAALKKFRNRTVYGNVVNDGIVPLRTSCLLFLDWQGLGRVVKARRDAGLVGTAISLGWAELTGASHTTRRPQLPPEEAEEESGATTPLQENSHIVPQPSPFAMLEDDRQSLMAVSIHTPFQEGSDQSQNDPATGAFGNFFSNLFRTSDSGSKSPSSETAKSPVATTPRSPGPGLHPKQNQIYRRSQTIKSESSASMVSSRGSRVTTGSEFDDELGGDVSAPPRTTLFESAHDLINPVIPDLQYILDPAKRPRTIFHDRVYHPEDIPALPLKRRTTSSLMRLRTPSKQDVTPGSTTPPHAAPSPEGRLSPKPAPGSETSDRSSRGREPDAAPSSVRVEEKIARGYHADLSWRKVLVKLEPDAHNNIIVRRTFANAFGWPVVHHLVEAHFSDSPEARNPDSTESSAERAEGPDLGAPAGPAGGRGEEEEEEEEAAASSSSASKEREAADEVPDMRCGSPSPLDGAAKGRPRVGPSSFARTDSVTWSERDWVDSENESADEGPAGQKGWNWTEKIVGKGAAAKAKPEADDGPVK